MKRIVRKIAEEMGFALNRIPTPVPYEAAGDLGLYRTELGDFYLPTGAPNDVILNHMRTGRIFEPEVVDIARRYIQPGSTALDLGSNFGQMAILFSQMTGPDGHVFAFEAQKMVFDVLRRNLDANAARNVTPVFGAVYHERGKVFKFPPPDFVRFEAYGSYNVPLANSEGNEVSSLLIDDLTFEKPISFMKVDVQGCDLFALQGAKNTIASHRMPIIFEFEQRFQAEYATSFQDYVDFVAEIGYRFSETVIDINYLILPN